MRDITKLEHLNAKGLVAWLYEVRPDLKEDRAGLLGSSLARRMFEWEHNGKQATLDAADRVCVKLDLHICEIPDHLWEKKRQRKRPKPHNPWMFRRALELLGEGYYPNEVAKMLGVQPRTVRAWQRRNDQAEAA